METYITLTGHQLKRALEFVNPDGEEDKDQLDCEVGIYEHGSKRFVFLAEHIEEGSEELPEGWEVIAHRNPKKGEYFLSTIGTTEIAGHDYAMRHLIIQKTKPREITLVETDEDAATTHFVSYGDVSLSIESDKIWRVKEE